MLAFMMGCDQEPASEACEPHVAHPADHADPADPADHADHADPPEAAGEGTLLKKGTLLARLRTLRESALLELLQGVQTMGEMRSSQHDYASRQREAAWHARCERECMDRAIEAETRVRATVDDIRQQHASQPTAATEGALYGAAELLRHLESARFAAEARLAAASAEEARNDRWRLIRREHTEEQRLLNEKRLKDFHYYCDRVDEMANQMYKQACTATPHPDTTTSRKRSAASKSDEEEEEEEERRGEAEERGSEAAERRGEAESDVRREDQVKGERRLRARESSS